MTKTRVLLASLTCALLFSGCATPTYLDTGAGGNDGAQPADPEPTWQEPDPEPTWQEPDPEPPVPAWTCFNDPTFNYDWHDDALCTNGLEYDRPYLREWDDYVTEEELMESAWEYEQQLNGE